MSIILASTATLTFICSYFLELTMNNIDQFMAIGVVIAVDGLFGVVAGTKREGFKTFKALRVLRTLAVWWIVLGAILAIEQAFVVASWLSETIIVPFLVFQIISILKNASVAGYIHVDILNLILDKIDQHKGGRIESTPTDATDTPIES
jgi:hypothetical protein